MSAPGTQDREAVNHANAKFWDELCGTGFAKAHGIEGRSLDALRRFDQAYFDFYPYLLEHVPAHTMRGQKVLEIGLGYGTLGQKIAESGAEYTGLDIARGPVDMMNHRLAMQGLPGRAIQGSMLDCPMPDASLDCVVSIGCFHHTGSVARCIAESWRVLKPGGRLYIMIYNGLSYRQWIKWPGQTLRLLLSQPGSVQATEAQRAAYDANSAGVAAPETEFISRRQLGALLGRFSAVRMVLENSDPYTLRGRIVFSRETLLSSLGKLCGLDIYARATK
jgi:SAM-dependent methyltransferase